MSTNQKALAFCIAGSLIFSVLAVAHSATARLEQSAALQCEQQDWPADKHAAMTAWCREFNLTREQFGHY
jgi:hypothetical protein